MPINLTISAEIIDITRDTPTSSDSFLIDTQIWLWMIYPSISQSERPPLEYQLNKYPQFVQKAIASKANLYVCGLSLSEIAHQIENTERFIYNTFCNQSDQQITSKEYRHNFRDERLRVCQEIHSAWNQVSKISNHLHLEIDDSTTSDLVHNLSRWNLDGHDGFFIEAMGKNSINKIITDDGDFSNVDGIQVFTSNQNVISAARTQGKLLAR